MTKYSVLVGSKGLWARVAIEAGSEAAAEQAAGAWLEGPGGEEWAQRDYREGVQSLGDDAASLADCRYRVCEGRTEETASAGQWTVAPGISFLDAGGNG